VGDVAVADLGTTQVLQIDIVIWFSNELNATVLCTPVGYPIKNGIYFPVARVPNPDTATFYSMLSGSERHAFAVATAAYSVMLVLCMYRLISLLLWTAWKQPDSQLASTLRVRFAGICDCSVPICVSVLCRSVCVYYCVWFVCITCYVTLPSLTRIPAQIPKFAALFLTLFFLFRVLYFVLAPIGALQNTPLGVRIFLAEYVPAPLGVVCVCVCIVCVYASVGEFVWCCRVYAHSCVEYRRSCSSRRVH